MIHKILKSAEITYETVSSYYDSLLNSKTYILQTGKVIFTQSRIWAFDIHIYS